MKRFKKIALKSTIVICQLSLAIWLIEKLLLGPGLVVWTVMASIVFLSTQRCSSCGTEFRDERLYGQLSFSRVYKTDFVDACPVCGDPMYGMNISD